MTHVSDLYLQELLDSMQRPGVLHDNQEFKLAHAEGACAALRDTGLLTDKEDFAWRQKFRAISYDLRKARNASYGLFAHNAVLQCPDCKSDYLHLQKVEPLVEDEQVILRFSCETCTLTSAKVLNIKTHEGNTHIDWKGEAPVVLGA